MGEMNNESLKTYIINDRVKLLNTIAKDIQNANFVKNFTKYRDTYLNSEVPVIDNKKRKKKIQRFRKISPYLAFCASYRDSKRDSQGKLKDNVLEITKQAGSQWKKMTEKDRRPWEQKAEELTRAARIAWDEKHNTSPTQTQESPESTYSAADIRDMKKSELMNLVTKSGIAIDPKASLKVIRERLTAHYATRTNQPTEEQIGRMKKDEL